MLRAIAMLPLLLFSTLLAAQDYKSEFQKICQEGNIGEALPLIEKWEKAKPGDPEVFIAYFNYYFNQSRKEVVRVGNEPGKGEHLALRDTATNEPVGFMYSELFYDDSLFQLAEQYITQGIAQHPRRLDMHFGYLYSLREAGFLEKHVDGILKVIDLHQRDDANAWQWSDNESIPDQEGMFKGSIQDYCHALFNLDDEPYAEGIEQISRKMMVLYPEDLENYSNIGVCRLMEKKYEEALEVFQKAHRINPKDAIVLSNIAYAYVQLGKKREAIEHYEKVVKSAEGEMADFAREEIKKLKNQ